MTKRICNYCGAKKHLHNYVGFIMCNDCIEKIKGQKIEIERKLEGQ